MKSDLGTSTVKREDCPPGAIFHSRMASLASRASHKQRIREKTMPGQHGAGHGGGHPGHFGGGFPGAGHGGGDFRRSHRDFFNEPFFRGPFAPPVLVRTAPTVVVADATDWTDATDGFADPCAAYAAVGDW